MFVPDAVVGSGTAFASADPLLRAPVFIQCARFDSDHNVRVCPEVYRLLGGPFAWYDHEHSFTSLEAMRDRLARLQTNLKLKDVASEFRKVPEPRPWGGLSVF